MSLVQQEQLTSFPRVVEKCQSAVDPLPVLQVKERVSNTFTVTALQNVLRWKYQRLCLQQVLHTIQDRMCSGVNISGFVSSRYYTRYRTECARVEISAALSPVNTAHNTGQNVLMRKYQRLCLQQILHTIQDRMCSGGNISGFVSSKYYTTHNTGQNVLGWKYQRLCLQQILHTIQDRMCSGGNISGFVSSRYYTRYRTECARVEISAALSPADTTHDTRQNVLGWKYQRLCLQQVLHTIQDRMCSDGNISGFVSSRYYTQYRTKCAQVEISVGDFVSSRYYTQYRTECAQVEI